MLQLFTFNGRLRRRDFFWRVPVLYLLAFGCYGLAAQQITNPSATEQSIVAAKLFALVLLSLCGYLVVNQSVKRLHDMDMHGLWLLLSFVPVINIILSCGLQFRPGTTGPNRYGPDPKQPQEAAVIA